MTEKQFPIIVRDFRSPILKKRKVVLALGSFDGVHIGHQNVIKTAVETAENMSLTAAVFTFWPHPRFLLKPTLPFIISNFRSQMKLFSRYGIEIAIVNRFNEHIRDLNYAAFVKDYLLENMQIGCAVVGYNYTFGKNAEGNALKLNELGKRYGFKVIIVPPVLINGEKVSSSKIRKQLINGSLDMASAMMGRDYSIASRVKKGAGRGSKIGIPTINLYPKTGLISDGVYCGNIELENKIYKAAINVGSNPTFGSIRHVEAHIIGFNGNLTGKLVTLLFTHFVRNEIKFDNAVSLVKQIKRDIEQCR